MTGTDPNRPTICFEDLEVGDFRQSRSRTVTRDEIVEFARQYDPQWFHSDPEAAKDSVFGEVVASGIHVLAMWRQLDHEINSDIDYVCGIGWNELRLSRDLPGLEARWQPFVGLGLMERMGRRWRLSDPDGMALSNQVLLEVVEWWESLPDPVAP